MNYMLEKCKNTIYGPVFWGIIILVIGILGLFGWIISSRTLVTIIPQTVSIAPISSVLFIIIGICFFYNELNLKRCRYTGVCSIILIIPAFIGFWVIFNTLIGNPELLNWHLNISEKIFWIAPESSMSPVSGLIFLLFSIGTYIKNSYRGLGYGIAIFIIFVALLLVLGYLTGHPFLYQGTIKPVSFMSSCAFFCCGMGLFTSIRKDVNI